MPYVEPITDADPAALLEVSGQVASGILQTKEMDDLWGRYHKTEKNNNPAHSIAKKIQEAGSNIKEDPELFAFVKNLIGLEYGAFPKDRKLKKNLEFKTLKTQVGHLKDFLDQQSLDIDTPKLKKLPEDYRRVLKIVRHHTAQNKWGPHRAMGNILKETAKHTWEEVKEKPVETSILTTLALGGLTFMNLKIGASATNYVDPEVLRMTNISADALTDPNFIPTLSDTVLTTSKTLSSHNHFSQILQSVGVNEEKALEIAQNVNMPGFLHKDKVKTLLSDSQNIMNSAYDWWNTRIAVFTKDPTQSLSDKVIPDSPFKQAFDNAAYNVSEFWYAANTVENLVFHTIVTFAGGSIAYKIGTMENEETSEHLNEVKDFGNRSWSNSKLSYILGSAGAAMSWMNHDGFTPWVVITGAAGLGIGEVAHRIKRKYNCASFAKDSTKDVREHLKHFNQSAQFKSNINSLEDLKNPGVLKQLWNKSRGATIAAGASLVVAADMAFNQGQLTGTVLGSGMVTGQFLAFNAVEDTAAHLIFGVLGGVVGLGLAGVRRSVVQSVKIPKYAAKELTKRVSRIKGRIRQRKAAAEVYKKTSKDKTQKSEVDEYITNPAAFK